MEKAFLILEDGQIFRGIGFGADAPFADELKPGDAPLRCAGEVVFNTGMTGYHEILTDPSYTGQIVTMTYPHQGNYGDSNDWSEIGPDESDRTVKAAGLIVRSWYDGPVPFQRETLHAFLRRSGIPAVSDIDTRRLTLRIRDDGSPNAVIIRARNGQLPTEAEQAAAAAFLTRFPRMEGRALLSDVGTCAPVRQPEVKGKKHFVLLDCGIKANIIRDLERLDCRVSILPSDSDCETILACKPDGVLISNGPGDPAVLQSIITVVKQLIGKVPLRGICLGHQLLSLALGGKTDKMKFGHHGVNHPVRDEFSKKVFVTSQNHGFTVLPESLPNDVKIWFRNANDTSVEGILSSEKNIKSVQFHPEAAPGPEDSFWIFKEFLKDLN